MTQEELWNWMMDGNYPPDWPKVQRQFRRAFATLSRAITIERWRGHDQPAEKADLPAGTRVKVVMASRFGDVGITDNLGVDFGYEHRVQCVPFQFEGQDKWIEPDALLVDIEPIDSSIPPAP